MASINDAVAEEMEKIREKAAQLGFLLKELALPGHSEIGAIVEEISGSAFRALSSMEKNHETPQASRAPDHSAGFLVVGSPNSSGDQRSSGHVVSSKRRKVTSANGGDRRGGFRRRTQQSTWRSVTTKTLDDGHTWRKYGQKDIQGTKYPRSYFRCTHRPDQGCKATRQVQRCEENPSTYKITYMGEHTCRDPTMVHQMLSASTYNDSCLISFETNNNNSSRLPTSLHAPKLPCNVRGHPQECDEEVLSNLTTGSSCSTDYNFVLPEMPQELISDHGDVTSANVDHNLDMDFNDYQFELENYFGSHNVGEPIHTIQKALRCYESDVDFVAPLIFEESLMLTKLSF